MHEKIIADAANPQSHKLSLIALTWLFFAWGFLTCLNDILIPHLRGVFSLTFAEAALVQSAFFLAYLVSSIPSGGLVGRYGYKRGIVIGLMTMAVGAFLFYPAATIASFPMFLFALFILASGITLLQVAANPYVTLLGSPQSASSRLNLTQAFNSLGTMLAPAIGGWLILSPALSPGKGGEGAPVDAAAPIAQALSVRTPYLIMGLTLVALALLFSRLRLPRLTEATGHFSFQAAKKALSVRHLKLGALGIFVYVGAEVAIGSFLVSYITANPSFVGGEKEAAMLVSFYWGAAMVGRFLGSFAMRYVSAGKILAACACGSFILITVSMGSTGYVSIYSLLAVGLCNSIMFPTIFSLGVRDLGPLTSVGSSIMVMAVVGGAVVPLIMGMGADLFGLKWALSLPAACYLYIAYYGLRGQHLPVLAKEPSLAVAP